MIKRKDLPSLYLGFSTSFLADLSRRFLRAMAIRWYKKIPKKSKQMIASAREKVLTMAPERLTSSSKVMSAVEISSSSGNSFETVSFLTRMGLMTAATPISRRTLTILLPITLPMRMSVLPLIIDEKETASSGAPVPKAMMVRPMRSLLTLKLEATLEAPSISQSAPFINNTKPIISKANCNAISIMLIL